jgi:methionyl-tRNA formyltransferase
LLALNPTSDLVSKLALVSPPQKSSKVPLPTREWATKAGIPIVNYHPKLSASNGSVDASVDTTRHAESLGEIVNLAKTEFDIGVVVDFGYMIPSKLIEAFPTTPILMHPSLLPKFRGAAPIEHAIMSGDLETGVTVLDVAPSKFDAGNMILQRRYSIDPKATSAIIRPDLAELGAKTLVEVLEKYEELKNKKVIQSEDESKAPKLTASDYLIRWDKHEAMSIYNRWRALGPLTTHLHGCKHMKSKSEDGTIMTLIHEPCHPDDYHVPLGLPSSAVPGTMSFDKPNNLLWVKCSTLEPGDQWLAIRSLQVDSGRRIMDATSFVNGIQLKANKAQYLESVGL